MFLIYSKPYIDHALVEGIFRAPSIEERERHGDVAAIGNESWCINIPIYEARHAKAPDPPAGVFGTDLVVDRKQ